MKPLLSIIVPVYNVEKYLKKCLDCIINQPFENFELILINDGSTDSSPEICDFYKQKDHRINVIHRPNSGLSITRNIGIEIARGDYLSFIDSDDFISNDYYQKNMDYLLENPNVDIAVMQVCIYDNKENKVVHNISKEYIGKDEIINYMMSNKYNSSVWINIYKKNIFKNIRFPDGKIYEDGHILLDVIKNINRVFVSDIGIYYYRKRENSIMQRNKTVKECFQILECHARLLDFCYENQENKKLFLESFSNYHLALIYSKIQYPNVSFDYYINKYQSFDYGLKDLINCKFSVKSMLKLIILKKIGFNNMVKIYNYLRIQHFN